MARILMPIPARDFDPTETAIPWRVLSGRGHEIEFATPDGAPGAADDIMVTGRGLDVWGFVPLLRRLVLVGGLLRANKDARAAYREMQASAAFNAPLIWKDARAHDFDALVLPGGHRARGMREYLESDVLQKLVADFFAANKPVGAICHGVLLAARSNDARTGRSVLFGRKTTALTWGLEKAGAALAGVTRFWDPFYYRTYREQPGEPVGHASVQAEVTRALAKPEDFQDAPASDPHFKRKSSGLARDSANDLRPSFVVVDGKYVSARWPGDAHSFALALSQVLEGQ